jgi:hypothetical protein
MSAPLRTCVSCFVEFELMPGKPGFANRCLACSTPKPIDPSVARGIERRMERERRKLLVQSVLGGEISKKQNALEEGRMEDARWAEKRIALLQVLKAKLG